MIKPIWSAPTNLLAFTLFSTDSIRMTPLRFVKQIHGNDAIVFPTQLNDPIHADAIITRTPETLCAIRTADCLPILITNLSGTEVAAIHAGWRGLAAGIIENTFAKIYSRPQDCIAWIGPAICKNCFEVGEDVLYVFLSKDKIFNNYFTKSIQADNKFFADLSGMAGYVLKNLGISHVYFSHICTMEDLRCNSYRRQKGTDQRMMTGIKIT